MLRKSLRDLSSISFVWNTSGVQFTQMRLFAKPVAIMLGLLLWAFPVFAAVPCTESHCAMEHNANCCQGMEMDSSAMQALSATILLQSAVRVSMPRCDCIVSSEVSAPLVMPETQKHGTTAVSVTVLASLLTYLAPASPPGYRTPTLRVFSCNAQSVLCSFLI
jgi:hypothetical protein